MRTLLDLYNNERGYVRVYADGSGFGYELLRYAPAPMNDLFEHMSGYPSIVDASAAAQHQLSSLQQARSAGRKRTLRAVRARRRS